MMGQRLPALYTQFGVHGNGHMMMLEKNNMAIARVMAEWIEHTLAGERRGRGRRTAQR
jgi:hypothetical protein